MSNTTELNDKLVSELRTLAKSFGVPDADSLRKPDLIAKITEQQNLIEAARLQQETVAKDYTEHNSAAAATEEAADKPRKRIRTLKSKIEQPRTEVHVDDTNLFTGYNDDDEAQPQSQQEDAESNVPAAVEAYVATEEPVQAGNPPEAAAPEARPQKFERRNNTNNNQQKTRSLPLTLILTM